MRFQKDDSGEPFPQQVDRRINEFAMMLIYWQHHARGALFEAEDGTGPALENLEDLSANADIIALWCDMTHPGIDPTKILELAACLHAWGQAYKFRNDEHMARMAREFEWCLPMPEVQDIATRAWMVFDRILSVVLNNPMLSLEVANAISADPERDTRKFSTITSPDVLALVERLKTNRNSGREEIEIARDFVGDLPGAERKATNLLRSARRHLDKWK